MNSGTSLVIICISFLSPVISHRVHDSTVGFCKHVNGVYHSFTSENLLSAEKCKTHIAISKFTNSINRTGWSYLEVEIHNNQIPNWLQGYAAGFVEGRATHHLIKLNIENTVKGYCDGAKEYCEKLHEFLVDNFLWMRNQIAENVDSVYWQQVNVTLNQLYGLMDGYEKTIFAFRTIEEIVQHPIFFIQLAGDIEDLALRFNRPSHLWSAWKGGHCSALVRMLPHNSDLLFSHVTWSSYATMLRVLKKISWKFDKNHVPGHTYSFSSYPGSIPSTDDFMLASSGLAIMETTISNYNKPIMKKYIRPDTVLCFIRSQVATRLALGNAEWADIFSEHNSGTYNNQWIIVDYKKFRPYSRVQPYKGLIHILEQLPGYIQHQDLSHFLVKQRYWPSYNMPFFPDVYNDSMTADFARKYGDWFTYEKTPRALIFKRDYSSITDMASMRKIMRSNNYTKDPLARCDCDPPYSAENAISCRSDLNPETGKYPFSALGHRDHGAIDMKLTNYQLFQLLQFEAISGPTSNSDDVPVFDWDNTELSKTTPHAGQPSRWDFKPVVHKWSLGVYKQILDLFANMS